MITLKNCPVCNHSNFKSFLLCKDYTVSNETFQIVSCDACGFKFTNPRPPEEKLGDYYKSEDYISHSDTSKGLISKLYKAVRTYTLRGKVNLIEKYSDKGNLLDYGCGTGMFLAAAKSSTWNVFGIEPDPGARNLASMQVGKEVFSDIVSAKSSIADVSFNCITLWHVLEHVTKLNDALSWFHTKLEKNGILIIAVPNHKSYDAKIYGEYWAAYDVPRHLSHFEERTVIDLLNRNGFLHVTSLPMKFDSFYVSMLSEKYKSGSISYIKAFLNGLLSNIRAKKASDYSSVIYVFKKA
jgi:predicted SAM-dependent methyltransferase